MEKTEEKPENIMIKYPVADIKEKNPDQLPFLSNDLNIEDSVEGNFGHLNVTRYVTDKSL